MGRILRTGSWLSVLPSTANGTELGAQERRNSLFLRYVIDSPYMPSHRNIYGSALSICHALDFKKGSLITARHNDLRDGVANLAGKDFTPVNVRNDPTFFTGRAVRGGEAKVKYKTKSKNKGAPPPDKEEDKGDILIRDLWTHGTDSIHNMRVVNTEAMY